MVIESAQFSARAELHSASSASRLIRVTHALGLFFFFQAEDGIRDYKVTGVQTCALPIYAKEMRLQRLSGHLIEDVNFGGGILGKLRKGGNFEVDQAEVGRGHWEITKLDVHITGRAIFFATIKQQQHEVRSDFREVPPGTTLAKAAE